MDSTWWKGLFPLIPSAAEVLGRLTLTPASSCWIGASWASEAGLRVALTEATAGAGYSESHSPAGSVWPRPWQGGSTSPWGSSPESDKAFCSAGDCEQKRQRPFNARLQHERSVVLVRGSANPFLNFTVFTVWQKELLVAETPIKIHRNCVTEPADRISFPSLQKASAGANALLWKLPKSSVSPAKRILPATSLVGFNLSPLSRTEGQLTAFTRRFRHIN